MNPDARPSYAALYLAEIVLYFFNMHIWHVIAFLLRDKKSLIFTS
jgi:hypothetical protein